MVVMEAVFVVFAGFFGHIFVVIDEGMRYDTFVGNLNQFSVVSITDGRREYYGKTIGSFARKSKLSRLRLDFFIVYGTMPLALCVINGFMLIMFRSLLFQKKNGIDNKRTIRKNSAFT